MNDVSPKPAVLPESVSDHAVFQPESGLWVSLRNVPSDYSHDKRCCFAKRSPESECLGA